MLKFIYIQKIVRQHRPWTRLLPGRARRWELPWGEPQLPGCASLGRVVRGSTGGGSTPRVSRPTSTRILQKHFAKNKSIIEINDPKDGGLYVELFTSCIMLIFFKFMKKTSSVNQVISGRLRFGLRVRESLVGLVQVVLDQRCPTHLPLVPCGKIRFKCVEWKGYFKLNIAIDKFMATFSSLKQNKNQLN